MINTLTKSIDNDIMFNTFYNLNRNLPQISCIAAILNELNKTAFHLKIKKIINAAFFSEHRIKIYGACSFSQKPYLISHHLNSKVDTHTSHQFEEWHFLTKLNSVMFTSQFVQK
ncbi:hypothetical protein RF11_11815 [Thelohanellus kitauei]|uniref:Uncharacterized protein n=1 Tax=Thelohanellus kitauei TaxID=669202 RepID=A0A0C2J1J3_THEKT|nr:hypothetical protein RF11_14439 [Thelohanellus kitauei]KII71714.1 hypothetical protein RF11_11815 [Thelohanellus kitauei]